MFIFDWLRGGAGMDGKSAHGSTFFVGNVACGLRTFIHFAYPDRSFFLSPHQNFYQKKEE